VGVLEVRQRIISHSASGEVEELGEHTKLIRRVRDEN